MSATERTTQSLPDFGKPPVIEVVCGISFKSLDRLLAPHLGLLWEKFKPSYPNCQEVPPLVQQVERFDPKTLVEAQLLELPPLPRIWFIDEKGNTLIQVQRDRFLHNWKKVEPTDEYPRFPEVSKIFRERLGQFEAFLRENGLGRIEPVQYELTYINHIPRGEGWDTLRDIGSVFPDFSWNFGRERFIPVPEAINWKSVFQLPEQTGRLHVSIRSANRLSDSKPILLLELTARGIGKEQSQDAMWSWLDTARTWIVRTFADLTDERLQKNFWGRKQ